MASDERRTAALDRLRLLGNQTQRDLEYASGHLRSQHCASSAVAWRQILLSRVVQLSSALHLLRTHLQEDENEEKDEDEDRHERKCDRLQCASGGVTNATSPLSSASACSSSSGSVIQRRRQVPATDSEAEAAVMETARRSVGLSLALVQQLSHVDSSSDEEDDEVNQLLAATVASDGAIRKSSGQQQQQQQQHPCQERRGSPDGKSSSSECVQQCESRLQRIKAELIDTEKRYCTCLWKLVNSIADSLISIDCLSDCQLSRIVPASLPQLHSLHCRLLSDLQSTNCCIPSVFLEFLDTNSQLLLKLYTNYLRQFSAAVHSLRHMRCVSADFCQQLRIVQSDAEFEGLDLIAFLLTPVQRLPRYLLLLRQMKQETGHSIEEEAQLAACIARLIRTLDALNVPINGALLEAGGDCPLDNEHQHHQHQHHHQHHHSLASPCSAASSSSSFSFSPTCPQSSPSPSGGTSSGALRRRRRSSSRPSLPRRLRRQRSCGIANGDSPNSLGAGSSGCCCCCCCGCTGGSPNGVAWHFAAARRRRQRARRCSSQPPPQLRAGQPQQRQQDEPIAFHLPATPPGRRQATTKESSERSLSVGNLAACGVSCCLAAAPGRQRQPVGGNGRRKSSSAFKESLRKIFLTRWKIGSTDAPSKSRGASSLLSTHSSSPDF